MEIIGDIEGDLRDEELSASPQEPPEKPGAGRGARSSFARRYTRFVFAYR